MSHKTAVILINVGTPDKPEVKPVRRYLSQFLNDRRVIDIPLLLQKMLVNLIIVPFRAPKSTRLYKRLWTEKGSPLIVYSESFKEKLEKKLPENYTVFNTMRYGKPNFKEALYSIQKENFTDIILAPMFPQYASSTTGSAVQAIMDGIKDWYIIPPVRVIPQFYNKKGFLNAFVKRAREYDYQEYDHIIFSFHGLPLRQVDKSHPGISNRTCSCSEIMPEHGKFCYKAACYETSRLIAGELNLPIEKYTVAFQSRLSKNWLEPFTDKTIENLAAEGKKNVLVLAPAFVADCLETIDEIGYENARLFVEKGGEKLTLVESLNDMDEWVDTMKELILA